ncbi:hypothetical protein D7Z26_06675 [Cohnella endophytica]|uniref:F5/8 type C domain-containing protein n=1 Tax=Cohnella endophytica TaxID=2419778 RepID=A0A494Y350_9BACL|nr:discoidin domain-containing protein [Cohnella endophytica]RKP54921.1 hypothetical protein D7Z26_06675 [Cohnella endophytica]
MLTKSLKKAVVLIMSALLMISVGMVTNKASAAQVVVSKIVTGSNGKSYVEVDGMPFMYENVENMGTWQLKGFNDNAINGYTTPLPQDWLENVFEKTKNAGYGMISLFLNWNDIEPTSQGVYDWTLIDKYISWGQKYSLRISFTWMGTDTGGGTRLPGYGAGWATQVPQYLQDWSTYWNTKGTPPASAKTSHYVFYATKTGTAGTNLKTWEKATLTALCNHLATADTTHRVISLMIENETHNIPDSWMSELAAAVKSSNYVMVVGQHQQKPDYRAISNYDFVGFDDYSTSISSKLGYLNSSPTSLKVETESGGNADNLTSVTVAAIANSGWLQAWELNDAFGNCYQYGMYETPNADYVNFKPDYLNWTLGTMPTLKYGAQKNKRLQLAFSNGYWVIAQAAASEMIAFNIETDKPVASYLSIKTLKGQSIGFKSDAADSKGNGSVGLVVNKGNSYYLLSDTGTTVTYYTRVAPTSATYGYQDTNGNWVSQGNVTVTTNSDGTWGIPVSASQVIKLDLPASSGNSATSATASATSLHSGSVASYVNDGTTSTSLVSADNPTFPYYATLSWSTGQTINDVNVKTIYSQRQAPTDYDVQITTDGSTWTTVASKTNLTYSYSDGTVETVDIPFTSRSNVKGLRLKINGANLYYKHVVISELETYGN